MLSENKLFSWTSKGALAAPLLFTILDKGVTLDAGKDIVRKYFGYDGQPIRGWADLIRIAQNLMEGYGVWATQKLVITGVRKGTSLVNRFLSGR